MKHTAESEPSAIGTIFGIVVLAAGVVLAAEHFSGDDQRSESHRRVGTTVVKHASTEQIGTNDKKITLTSPITYHETSTGQQVPSRIGNFRYYSQTDNRWAWDRYNTSGHKGYDIGLNGCAPTTGAMLVSNLLGKRITPVMVADYYMRHDFVIPDKEGGGTDGEPAVRSLAKAYGLKAFSIDRNIHAIERVIDDGGFIVLNGQDSKSLTPASPAGHVLMIRGYTPDHQLEIGDPASIANTMSAFNPDLITGPAGYLVAVTNTSGGR